MNSATAATTVELHAIGDVEFRRVYVDCGIASCRGCRRGPSHGPYWFATWIEGGQPRECLVGRDLKLDELRAKLSKAGHQNDRAIAGLFRRIETFEQRIEEEAAARKRRIDEAARAGERERIAWEKFKQVRAEKVRSSSTPIYGTGRAPANEYHQEQASTAGVGADTGSPSREAGSRPFEHRQNTSGSSGGGASSGDAPPGSQRRKATARAPLTGPWRVFGIPPSSSSIEIKRRYRMLAMEYHPDRGGDPEEMKRLNAALLQLEQLGVV